jgi:hypothetical protein
VKRYADPGRSAAGAYAMALDKVISYLRQTDDSALAPLASIMAQTEAIGDPALPTIEQAAILRWVSAAFDHWQEAFPLDPALAARLQLVKPVAAALALVEPDFLIPGEHPLHRILDSLQLGAVGWQTTLGRAGQALEKQVTATVDTVLTWFDDDALDLETTCNEVIANSRRDMARADRMTRRLIETEQGRIKTQEAKRHAADMINKALREYRAPPAIGEFLKGHWYESAQLILLKFGRESVEWQQMSAATAELLDSMQPTEADDTKRRQYLFEAVTRLPKELIRWLISLQHDRAALDEVVGLVEYAHLGILRNQPLELEQTEPVAANGCDYRGRPERATPGALDSLQEGQWYLVRPGRADATRARLILRMDQAGQPLFASLAGVKGSPQSGQVATCRTLDVSKGGLRVSLDRELPEGAILQIGVELPQSSETLYLAGEVRWCHRDQEAERHWTAGFALLNADQSDIDRWVALLAAMERGPQDRG